MEISPCLSFMPVAHTQLGQRWTLPSLSLEQTTVLQEVGGVKVPFRWHLSCVSPVNTPLSTSLSLICISHARLSGLKLNMPDSCGVMQN